MARMSKAEEYARKEGIIGAIFRNLAVIVLALLGLIVVMSALGLVGIAKIPFITLLIMALLVDALDWVGSKIPVFGDALTGFIAMFLVGLVILKFAGIFAIPLILLAGLVPFLPGPAVGFGRFTIIIVVLKLITMFMAL